MWLALLPLALADDAAIVAEALRRQEARLEAEGCTTRYHRLDEVADRLEDGMQGNAVAQAGGIAQATGAILSAKAREARCAEEQRARAAGTEPTSERRVLASYTATIQREDLREAGFQLARWGERDAAAAWATLIEPATPPRKPERYGVDGCRCMDTLVPGRRIVYGYPTQRSEMLSSLGVISLGGCVIDEDSRFLSCPYGCYPDKRRLGDGLARPTVDWHIVDDGPVWLAAVGTPEAIARLEAAPPDTEALAPLSACVAETWQGAANRAEDGTWVPRAPQEGWGSSRYPADACVSAWADENLIDPGLMRIVVQ
ncbi:MAG: hypothetical protein H6739_01395 [Alphaproteobacteria bacterium]|nr:hypothetical protein [Alphaproteobacteria bacterium]